MNKFLLLSLIVSLFVPIKSLAMSEVMRLMAITCDKKKEPKACYNLANMYQDRKDTEQAEKYFKLACMLDYELACKRVPWEKHKRETLSKKPTEKKFFQKQCEPLFEKLSECVSFKCTQEHFIVSENFVTYQVHSTDLNGVCKYTMSMPEGKETICLLDKLHRKRFRDRSTVESFALLEDYERVGICNVRQISEN